ncbi:radical SAM/SPASM domain-containing protein [Parachryseolinea silvisoli]|uniref:radical SAM/SPASM domain-containing protein n=1 Tax=Parachryseolinea silvisoli TaxID=2873601 RepID=UPI002265811F|nr:radical SAM protein [Parachryseolinea silvisoli]MCD9019436.1 SPASM domain-containing protein [Parachryseolinea silvisoli]
MKSLKLSYYTIASGPVNEAGQWLMLSTRSGRMVLVNDICVEFLKNDLVDNIPEPIREKLVANNILVDAEENELESIVQENNDYIDHERSQLYEVIQASANCQLGCHYCGQQHTKNNIADPLIDTLVDRIHDKFMRGGYKTLHIGWFGAEPLMGLPQMRAINKKLRQVLPEGVLVTGKVVTNGLSLKDDIFDELVRDFGVTRVEVTLDGIEEHHNRQRYLKAGGGSFEVIYKNLKRILLRPDFDRAACKVTIRCNVSYDNVAGVEPLIQQIASDGLHTRIANLYFVGIYSWGGNEAHKTSLTKEQFAMKRMKWEIAKIKLGYPFDSGAYGRTKMVCIATGGESEVYDAYGNIYNCTEIPYADYYNDKGYKLGKLGEATPKTGEKPFNDWYTSVRDTDKYPCHTCRLLPVCGGGCPKSWVEDNVACPPLKYSILKDMQFRYLLRTTPGEQLASTLSNFDAVLKEEDFFRYK